MQNKIDTEHYTSLLSECQDRLSECLSGTNETKTDNSPIVQKLAELSEIIAVTDRYFKMLPNLPESSPGHKIVEEWSGKVTQYTSALNAELDVVMENTNRNDDVLDIEHTPTNTSRMP